MTLRLLYFARLRELFGTSQEHATLPDAVPTVADLLDRLRARGGVWAEQLAPERSYRVAVNQDLAESSTALHDNDEVAIFPPVTGG